MHIYKLAAELGLIQLEYMDRDVATRVDSETRKVETERIRQMSMDVTQWGGWPAGLHESFVQKNRQWRAYVDVYREKLVTFVGGQCDVNGWRVTFNRCGCPDFDDRKLPCKHIYALAISSDLVLPLALSDYEAAAKNGEELFFHHWGPARCKEQGRFGG